MKIIIILTAWTILSIVFGLVLGRSMKRCTMDGERTMRDHGHSHKDMDNDSMEHGH